LGDKNWLRNDFFLEAQKKWCICALAVKLMKSKCGKDDYWGIIFQHQAEIVLRYSDSREVFFENPRLKLPSALFSHLSGPKNVIDFGLDSW
jgi:hypothetical protein